MTDVHGANAHPADRAAFAAATGVRPMWVSQRRAGDAIGLRKNVLLHAGPAFESPADVSRPIRNSACVAAVFEGLAPNFAEAADAIDAGTITLRPAQDFNAVVPLASVISSSMWLHEVVDATGRKLRAFAPINGGGGPALRLGVCSDQTLAHLRWLNGEFAEVLLQLLDEPVDLIEIAQSALAAGDDCHGRTGAATQMLAARFRDGLAAHPQSQAFLQTGPSFFLNLWMAACRCVLNGAVGIAGSSMVTVAGGNGRQFGIQLAGAPGRWIAIHADPPHGPWQQQGSDSTQPLGAIGDSALVDVAGFGAMALRYSEAQRQALGPFAPDDSLARPAQLFLDTWPAFGDLHLLTGLCARQILAADVSPLVSLGILDAAGIRGRLAGGIYAIPTQLFVRAMNELRALET